MEIIKASITDVKKIKVRMEMPGFEPGAFHMRSERATTALHPLFDKYVAMNLCLSKYLF